MMLCAFCNGVGDEFTDEEGFLWHVCPVCGGDGVLPDADLEETAAGEKIGFARSGEPTLPEDTVQVNRVTWDVLTWREQLHAFLLFLLVHAVGWVCGAIAF